ncbi:hypothetical protein PUNSTDRAFT_142175 [Punctularia strigosozonata HHB-11173 SS5]|uniref:uncharacterized protein n=1 Tax=Punctularia strigosozonata (strain HHB-11173) TaxID=741275 RepID=UPI00044180EB|nr:uncharacterized protein PUNSTDRAFT_142175 [Punctularia strigosozonata HHB-11173 SS5]EIN11988.1 hypothetical protein PUNSTDRAFT_142175 [Punctularia strigosozonata HHB-11173 SS5]
MRAQLLYSLPALLLSTLATANTEMASGSGEVSNVYDSVLKGFAAQIPDSYLTQLQAFQAEAGSVIDYIEPDGIVTTQ